MDFKDLFDGTLGNCDTEPFELELKPYYKPFNNRYDLIPIFNKETFRKELKRRVEIVLPTPVQKNQYGTPIFMILNKEGTVRLITYYLRLN